MRVGNRKLVHVPHPGQPWKIVPQFFVTNQKTRRPLTFANEFACNFDIRLGLWTKNTKTYILRDLVRCLLNLRLECTIRRIAASFEDVGTGLGAFSHRGALSVLAFRNRLTDDTRKGRLSHARSQIVIALSATWAHSCSVLPAATQIPITPSHCCSVRIMPTRSY
jgi:hypothetical protein